MKISISQVVEDNDLVNACDKFHAAVYHVSWSPCLPAVILACSFDRRVQFFPLAGKYMMYLKGNILNCV
jgi:hypothetical protein